MVGRPSLIDLHAEIRSGQKRWTDFQEEQSALHRKLVAAPINVPAKVSPGTTPDELAAEINEARVARTLPLAILAGRKEWKRLKQMDGAEDNLEYWLGGEETFAGIAIIIRKGAGAVRVFTDLQELDAAVRDLPQPHAPPARYR